MNRSRLLFCALATFFALGSITSSKVNAQSFGSGIDQAVGLYQSRIWDTDTVSLLLGTTEFKKSGDDSLAGSYTMIDPQEVVAGTLTQCQAGQFRVLRCVWTDKSGTGTMEIIFSDNFSSFNGYWGEGNSEPVYLWRGSR